MKVLNNRLKKLEQQTQSDILQIDEFRVIDQDNAERHRREMMASGYRLVRDRDGFQLWASPV